MSGAEPRNALFRLTTSSRIRFWRRVVVVTFLAVFIAAVLGMVILAASTLIAVLLLCAFYLLFLSICISPLSVLAMQRRTLRDSLSRSFPNSEIAFAFLVPPLRDFLSTNGLAAQPLETTVAVVVSSDSLEVWDGARKQRQLIAVSLADLQDVAESNFDGYRCIAISLGDSRDPVPLLFVDGLIGIRQRDITELTGNFRSKLGLPATP